MTNKDFNPGPTCSKSTTLLVNISHEYYKYNAIFCSKNVRIFSNANDSYIFPTKNNSLFDNVVGIYLTSCCLYDVVRLTKL